MRDCSQTVPGVDRNGNATLPVLSFTTDEAWAMYRPDAEPSVHLTLFPDGLEKYRDEALEKTRLEFITADTPEKQKDVIDRVQTHFYRVLPYVILGQFTAPVAYRSQLPLNSWAAKLRSAGIPCQVSYHAGTFLCNATMFLTHHEIAKQRLDTRATFVHLPLTCQQITGERTDIASLPVEVSAAALHILLQEIVNAD